MTTSTQTAVAAWIATVVLGAWSGLAPGEVPMGESVEYPHAGVALAMPADYQILTVAQPFDITRAILSDKGQPVQAVTVSALPLADPNASAEELADAIIAAQEQNLAIRNLQVLSKAAMKVADQPAAARFISYSFRGDQTVAASVVFCRTLEPQGRLQYVITVEAIADRKAEVLPVLGEVVKSVRLLTVVRPIDIPLRISGRMVEAPGGTYALPVPHGWYAQTSEAGVSMAQTDYTLGGQPALSACVLIADAPAGETLQQHARQCITAAERNAAEEGMEAVVLSDGPARFGNAVAHQLAFEERVPRPATSGPAEAASQPATAEASQPVAQTAPTSAAAPPEPTTSTAPAAEEAAAAEPNNVVIVQRSVLLANPRTSAARRMTLALVCVDANPTACIQVFDKLADGMVLRAATTAPAATQPAEPPAATTAPAAKGAKAKPKAK
jgi:hypothetical protein